MASRPPSGKGEPTEHQFEGEKPMVDLAKFIVFKPIGDGYVYRTPNAWGFGSGRHYLVNEHQKAEILRTITSSSRHVFWVTGISWGALFVLLATGALMWVDRTNHPTLSNILIWVALISSLYAALLISRQVLSRRLQPVLAILPGTNERITKADMRQKVPPVVLSPARQKVLTICLVLMPFLLVAILISRAVDMHEATHQPIFQALYLANADLLWLIIAWNVFWVGAILIRNKSSRANAKAKQHSASSE
jgi:hypothetical protein